MNCAFRAALWTLWVAAVALADITNSGPYTVDFERFSPCDDIGSLSIEFEVRLIMDSDNNTVYEGNLTFPYDLDDKDLLTSLLIDQWGSTGGWSRLYNITECDPFNYMKNNFPTIFKAFYGSMGITDHPAPAGTYYMKSFRPVNMKVDNIESLLYGRFRLVYLQSKGGTNVGCLQANIIVNEVALLAMG